MRLICPNCQAQYEVPVEVIPDEGRDVQCSNCGTSWFQDHPHALGGDAEPEPDHTFDAPAPPASEPVPDIDTTPETSKAGPVGADEPAQNAPLGAVPGPDAPSDAPASEPYSEGSPDENETEASPADPETPLQPPEAARPPTVSESSAPVAAKSSEPPRSRRLDPGVAEVLRAEAEYEARHRAAEGGPLESQPDLGLQGTAEVDQTDRDQHARERVTPKDDARPAQLAAAERARAAASSTGDVGGRGRYDRDADMLGDQGPTPAETASRRGLLPDVDEINQSLRPSDRRRPVETPQNRLPIDEDTGSGFGSGFVTVLAIGIVLIAVYLAAPNIAATVPALADPLAAYVGMVNAARVWLDGQVTAFLVWLGGLGSTG